MKRPTARDVARLAGVDPSTVSRVLNQSFGQHRYAAETVDRIRQAAQTLGYRPSLTARALRNGRTMLVGMIVSDIANPFFADLAAAIEQLAWSHGYRVVICSTAEDLARQDAHIADLVARGIDGLMISPCLGEGLLNHTLKLPPTVLLDRPVPGASLPFAGLDNHRTGAMLGQLLSARHYRHVGIVLPASHTDPTLSCRLEGLTAALDDPSRLAWTVDIPEGSHTHRHAAGRTRAMLETNPHTDALIGLTNWCTLGILEALSSLQRSWGDTMGVAGIDDFAGADLMSPSITVAAQPVDAIAASAFSMLLSAMQSPSALSQAKHDLIEPVLIDRQSLPVKKKED